MKGVEWGKPFLHYTNSFLLFSCQCQDRATYIAQHHYHNSVETRNVKKRKNNTKFYVLWRCCRWNEGHCWWKKQWYGKCIKYFKLWKLSALLVRYREFLYVMCASAFFLCIWSFGENGQLLRITIHQGRTSFRPYDSESRELNEWGKRGMVGLLGKILYFFFFFQMSRESKAFSLRMPWWLNHEENVAEKGKGEKK